MKKHKVLMLGWEYPPFINGGLGVACTGLCNALSEYTDITFVVPMVSEDQIKTKYKTIGLNKLNEEFVAEILSEEVVKEVKEEYKVDIELEPYILEKKARIKKKLSSKEIKKIKKEQEIKIKSTFQFEKLYGDDIIQKVIFYAELVKKISANFNFDIIHAHDWMTFLAGMELKKSTGKPLVLHVHSLDYDRAGSESRGWIYDIERTALHSADLIMPVSQYTGSILTSHYGIASNKIQIVYNGIDSEEVYKSEKSFPEKMVLFIGRLTGQKGPEYFLDIATKIYQRYKDVRFVIAGTGEKLTHLLEDGAYRQIGNRVHFTGFITRKKIKDLLSMADVYCMPSVSEPFGLTALEAAQFEVPTVISERSGVAEVLKGSLKADFWDIDLMVDHIIQLLTNDKKRMEVIQNNKRDLENLSWRNAAKTVSHAYDLILKKNKTHAQST